jgi:hypothetical protein
MVSTSLCCANTVIAILHAWHGDPSVAIFNAFVAGWLFYQFILDRE